MHTFNTFTNSQQNDNLIAFKLLKELSGIAMYLLCKYKLQKFQLSPKRANINIHQTQTQTPCTPSISLQTPSKVNSWDVQTEGRTHSGKTICPNFQLRCHIKQI